MDETKTRSLGSASKLSTFLQASPLRLLIVSACTSKKKFSPGNQLTADDLDDKIRRSEGELRLANYLLPAADMYIGDGHKFVRQAVAVMQEHDYEVSHFIVSAGYGLLNEADPIVPYNVTFSRASKTWIRERGQRLGLRNKLIKIASEHDRAILILGREYLEAIGLPLPVVNLPSALMYLAPSLVKRVGGGIETIAINESERRRIGAYSSSAKEKRFNLDTYQFFI